METLTPNYRLRKQDEDEFYSETINTDNMDTIDAELKENADDIAVHTTDYTLQVPYGGTTTGTANTYAIATPTIAALAVGMAVSVKFNLDSTAASTLNWCGQGAKPIKKANGTNVTNLKATGIYTLRYDGTNFILQGEGASGNATASDLISGKTATVDAGEITGTLALTGTAVAADILATKTAYNTNPKTQVTGTMVNNGAVTITPSTVQQTITGGHHNGSGYVVGDADLIADNIKKNINIFGVVGNIDTPLISTNFSGLAFLTTTGEGVGGISPSNIFTFGYNGGYYVKKYTWSGTFLGQTAISYQVFQYDHIRNELLAGTGSPMVRYSPDNYTLLGSVYLPTSVGAEYYPLGFGNNYYAGIYTSGTVYPFLMSLAGAFLGSYPAGTQLKGNLSSVMCNDTYAAYLCRRDLIIVPVAAPSTAKVYKNGAHAFPMFSTFNI
ncbi:MAG: hypothetical protein CVU92_02345 [Firmicutes bacterium HGW-Firmicutes-17]|jgi:hypothetical protein|nr:MAG: hypothetical protein CVU92_02345 [Firmicutes bacterium HGW-Firmicutes-17]